MRNILMVCCLTLVASTAGCALPAGSGRDGGLVTGTVFYRERIAISPQSVVRVTLEDISRADAASAVIAETRFQASGGPPYAFALGYDPAMIDDRHRYTLRATIRLEGELLFTSTEHIPPFQDGKVEILVRRSSGP
jgi:putative lipoprotein